MRADPALDSFPELSTERLHLRAMVAEDADGYSELLADPGTHPFITESGPIHATEVPGRIRRNLEAFRSRQHIYWSAELEGQFVGYVALHGAWQPSPAISYAVREAWRRRGVASEAVAAVREHAFSKLGARELIARTHIGNDASVRLLVSLGFLESQIAETPGGPRREFVHRAP